MKKTITQIQYSRLLALYQKLKKRLNRNFTTGRFHQFTRTQQQQLLQRVEKLKSQLLLLERGLQLAGTALALTAVMHIQSAEAQLVKKGGEFQINSYVTGNQTMPKIAQDANGNFVVTWQSPAQDGNGSGIYAQRYNASGVAQGSEFLVNTYTTSDQSLPAIGMDDSGNFVVTWQSYGQDGNGKGIYAQRYDATGTAQGSEFLVNTTTSNNQIHPAIAVDGAGDFVITWSSNYDVYAKRYNASGAAQGSEFIVNTYTTNYQDYPAVAIDNVGDFVVSWQSYAQDGDGYGVYAQRFNASGAAQGSEFIVNTHTSGYQEGPSVAMDNSGDFIIAWGSYQDGDNFGVYGQRFNAAGTKQGSEFLVNTYTFSTQIQPTVAINKSTKDFVIAFQGAYQDAYTYAVYAQRYDATGTRQGSVFEVNTTTASDQLQASAVLDTNGDLIIVWQSDQQDDASSYGIFGQRYTNNAVATANHSQTATSLFNLYPNPAKDQVQLSYDGNDAVQVKVMNMSGTLISEQSVSDKIVHIEGLKAGVYLLEMTKDGAATERKKLVIE